MPPLVSRKKAATRKQAVAKKNLPEHVSDEERSNSNHENEKEEEELSYQTTTPVRRSAARAGKADTEEIAPLDTLVALRRTRRVIAEQSPSPSPVASRGRAKAPSKGRAASKPTGKTRVSTRGRSKPKPETDSGDEGEHRDQSDSGDVPSLRESGMDNSVFVEISDWNAGRASGLSGSEEIAALATPTKKRGNRVPSLGSPSTRSTRGLSSKAALSTQTRNTEPSAPAGRGTRKRGTGALDEHGTSELAVNEDGRTLRKRNRQSKSSAHADINSDEGVDQEEELPAPATPSTPTTRSRTHSAGKTKANAKKTKADELRGSNYDVYVDIVSPSKFERSRSKIQSSGLKGSALGASKGKDALDSLPFSSPTSKDSEKWQKKYEELFALRQTKPEQELEKFRDSASTRFEASDRLIEKLRKEIAEAKKAKRQSSSSENSQKETPAASAPVKTAAEKELEKHVALLRKDVEALTQDVLVKDETIERLEQHRKLTETSTDYNLREKLRLIQELSGLSVDDVVPEDDGVSYVCRQSGPAAHANFVLTAFDDIPDEYQYTPCGKTATLDVLPDYLKESMSFAKPAANMFFWRLCDHLHNQQQSEAHSENSQNQPESQPVEAEIATTIDVTTANAQAASANGERQAQPQPQ
ncbi:hypothetical protein H4R99_002571 [Coemansia sp. RSA 1722]|nr:hypothetical protein H4R99_002571 [Coemansia sp. RSA 1722]